VTFKEGLAQVMHWLQQEKRLSYRALKRPLALDDDLDALQAELIEVRHVEEDRRVLVWTGGADATPSPLPASSSARQPATQQVLPSSATPPVAPSSSDAERRQLTVLFCDLVDPIALSGQRDPEDPCEVVGAYQDTCGTVIARVDGHIAQYLGDGLVASFGYPLAYEDAAQRAVRAGMGEAIGQLHTHLTQARRVQLAVRLGGHTGLVVVGDVGDRTRQEQWALGEAPEDVHAYRERRRPCSAVPCVS
jgi:class 3 adenylate cyclase